MIDLHLHSEFSIDSRDSPEALIEKAYGEGIRVISLTEHENTESRVRGQKRALELGMEYVNGIEYGLRIPLHDRHMDVHILGYFFEDLHPRISELAAAFKTRAALKTEAFFTGLRLLDIPVNRELVSGRYPGRESSWAIRRVLREEGFAEGKPESAEIEQRAVAAAAEKDGKFSALGDTTSPDTVIRSLKADGASVFYAHPFWSTSPARGGFTEADVWKQIERMLDLGVDGLEAHNIYNGRGYTEEMLRFCRSENLPACGGSDCHGAEGIGKENVDRALYESMIHFKNGQQIWP